MDFVGQKIHGCFFNSNCNLFFDRIKECIGKGGFGEVYFLNIYFQKKIKSIKIIKIHSGSKNDIKMMEREFTTGFHLGTLSPFLMKFSEFYGDEKYCNLLMELCSGGSL
jgi:serine/threonine protein kinase